MTTTEPTSAAAASAVEKLTQRELQALRAQLRRELAVELADADRARRAARRADRARAVEVPEAAAAASRMTRALGKRAALDVAQGLPALAQLRDDVDAALADAVTTARAEHGYSWTQVGDALGIRRQTAQQRFAPQASA